MNFIANALACLEHLRVFNPNLFTNSQTFAELSPFCNKFNICSRFYLFCENKGLYAIGVGFYVRIMAIISRGGS